MRLILRNTTVPTRKRQVFTTSVDNQNFVPIHVLQGERDMAKDNTTLARFELTGIPPAPRGVPQVEVCFDINEDGIVSVTAKDLGTGREHVVRVAAGSGLGEHDIERIVAEAETHRGGDEQRKALAQARLEAESLLYTTEQALSSYGDVLSPDDHQLVADDIVALKEVIPLDNPDAIIAAKTQLETSAYRIAEVMYAQVETGGEET